jgi:tRNA (guanine37-N1)-methyltransferase
MIFDVLTLFPLMFDSPLSASILKRAIEAGLIEVNIRDIRDFAKGRHKQADDRPYGGGSGMVMMPQPIADALKSIPSAGEGEKRRTLLLSPQGRPFNQARAEELVELDRLILICGHYEGIDERIRELYVDEELSIGDYVLTGGELGAMVVMDAVSRLIPGVVGDPGSLIEESFSDRFLEYPHYTRPEVFEGRRVPEVLLSGHHENIRRWRKRQQIKRTALRRPDLLANGQFTREERDLLEAVVKEQKN